MITTVHRPARATILRLAWSDLAHEWILALCMVLAISAVLAPLLILMGLKVGTIQTLRDRLVEDPVNREIRPQQTLTLSGDWLESLAARDDIAFAIPTILRGSSIARVESPAGSSMAMDLIPTAPGDPLILDNGGQVPGAAECVLSYPAGEELKVAPGAQLIVTVTRTRDGVREQEQLKLTVRSVLDPRADGLPRLYAPRTLVEDIETYREGMAVPDRGWSGGQPRPFMSFDGVRIVAPEPLSPLTLRQLTIGTGLVDLDPLTAAAFAERAGFPLLDGASAYELKSRGGTVQQGTLRTLRNRLRGQQTVILPFVEGLPLQLTGEATAAPIGLSISSEDSEQLGLPMPPWGALDPDRSDVTLRQVLVAFDQSAETQPMARLSQVDRAPLEFPLAAVGQSFGDRPVIPVELLGILRTSLDRPLEFHPDQGGLLLARSGYRGFRLYARSIDDVPGLYRWFIDQGIPVLTQVQEIQRVQVLDRGLSRVFWLVAVVGIIGGMASLIASLYGAVERKKRDISVLRLMGLNRLQVFRFPVYQALTMAVLSVALAILAYSILAYVINGVFASDLQMGQKICTLPPSYFGATLVITVLIAFVSSLLAAWKTTRIDPAEALREE